MFVITNITLDNIADLNNVKCSIDVLNVWYFLVNLLFVFDSFFEAAGHVVVVASPPYQRPGRQAGKSWYSRRFCASKMKRSLFKRSFDKAFDVDSIVSKLEPLSSLKVET